MHSEIFHKKKLEIQTHHCKAITFVTFGLLKKEKADIRTDDKSPSVFIYFYAAFRTGLVYYFNRGKTWNLSVQGPTGSSDDFNIKVIYASHKKMCS